MKNNLFSCRRLVIVLKVPSPFKSRGETKVIRYLEKERERERGGGLKERKRKGIKRESVRWGRERKKREKEMEKTGGNIHRLERGKEGGGLREREIGRGEIKIDREK